MAADVLTEAEIDELFARMEAGELSPADLTDGQRAAIRPRMQQRFEEGLNEQAGMGAPPTDAAAPELFPDPSFVRAWERDGFFVIRGLIDADMAERVNHEAIGYVRDLAGREGPPQFQPGDMIPVPEPNLMLDGAAPLQPEDHVSKLFNLHRTGVFHDFAMDARLTPYLTGMLGPDVDCFNSQFIFKNPGAWGQPWHQDSLYFRFDRFPQAGAWLATSEANERNGCLFVAPGSHAEPLHTHVTDRRPEANLGYVEIVDYDFSNAVAVEMEPGDVLFFHSFLMHKSGDNTDTSRRTALVHHFASTGTTLLADQSATIDFMPVAQGAAPVA